MISRVLFVCLGNICRSPTAEGLLKHLLSAPGAAVGRDIVVDSAGTADYHVGEPPDPRSQRAARRRGVDLSGLVARQVGTSDFDDFDLVLAMDRENLRELEARRPAGARAEVRLFLEYVGETADAEVPDPYTGDAEDFDHVFDVLAEACRRLIARLS